MQEKLKPQTVGSSLHLVIVAFPLMDIRIKPAMLVLIKIVQIKFYLHREISQRPKKDLGQMDEDFKISARHI